MEDLKRLLLKDIRPDENQPRKFYDETAMQELTDSIRQKDVLQPILVRPNGKGYIIVAGERRYRAAVAVQVLIKDRNTIPAVIRVLTDEEALEIQIIENLQRKDVHPMEEAVAFKSLLENKNKKHTVDEIAARVGKSVFYIRQRIKLNSLIKDWQDVFYTNKINNHQALLIAPIDSKTQLAFYKNNVSPSQLKDANYYIRFSSFDLERIQQKLNNAPFDKLDITLNPVMGACSGCAFNSAVACLFPEDAKDPRCNNPACYKIKTDESFARKLKEAIDDPGVVLVDKESYRYEKSSLIEKLKKDGNAVYGYNEHNEIKTGNKEYKEGVKTGSVLKAFIVAGSRVGTYTYISLKKESSSKKQATEKISSGEATLADINDEIKRINDREKRTSEIDEQKIWAEIKDLFDPAKCTISNLPFTIPERDALANSIASNVGYQHSDKFRKMFKANYDAKEGFRAVSEQTLNMMCRYFFLAVLPPAMLYSGYNSAAMICLKLAKQYFPDKLKAAVDKQTEVASNRRKRIASRINSLNEKKKELKLPVTKTVSPKQTALKAAKKK